MANDRSEAPGSSENGGGAPRDRRATHRAALEIPAVLHVGTRHVDCSIRNLSREGIALAVKESVAPGMVVRVVFRLPNARQLVEVAGVLVRTGGGRSENVVGLQFIEPNADAVRVIDTFVARNRSDLPFSERPPEAPTAPGVEVVDSRPTESLEGLYKRAVSDVAEKGGKRRGLFARWRRRGKS